FHLLRLAELLFQGAAFGYTFGKKLEDYALVAIGHRASRDPDDGGRAVLALPICDQSIEVSRRSKIIGQVEPLMRIGIERPQVRSLDFGDGSVAQHRQECR